MPSVKKSTKSQNLESTKQQPVKKVKAQSTPKVKKEQIKQKKSIQKKIQLDKTKDKSLEKRNTSKSTTSTSKQKKETLPIQKQSKVTQNKRELKKESKQKPAEKKAQSKQMKQDLIKPTPAKVGQKRFQNRQSVKQQEKEQIQQFSPKKITQAERQEIINSAKIELIILDDELEKRNQSKSSQKSLKDEQSINNIQNQIPMPREFIVLQNEGNQTQNCEIQNGLTQQSKDIEDELNLQDSSSEEQKFIESKKEQESIGKIEHCNNEEINNSKELKPDQIQIFSQESDEIAQLIPQEEFSFQAQPVSAIPDVSASNSESKSQTSDSQEVQDMQLSQVRETVVRKQQDNQFEPSQVSQRIESEDQTLSQVSRAFTNNNSQMSNMSTLSNVRELHHQMTKIQGLRNSRFHLTSRSQVMKMRFNNHQVPRPNNFNNAQYKVQPQIKPQKPQRFNYDDVESLYDSEKKSLSPQKQESRLPLLANPRPLLKAAYQQNQLPRHQHSISQSLGKNLVKYSQQSQQVYEDLRKASQVNKRDNQYFEKPPGVPPRYVEQRRPTEPSRNLNRVATNPDQFRANQRTDSRYQQRPSLGQAAFYRPHMESKVQQQNGIRISQNQQSPQIRRN